MPLHQTPLSFEEASSRLLNKQITWKEYLHHLFLHCLPEWHVQISGRPINWRLMDTDPFAYSVYRYHSEVTGVTDPAQLEAVFDACENGTIDDVRARLGALTPFTASCVRGSLALLALRGKKLEILQLCLAEPVAFWNTFPDRYFEDIANRVEKDKDPELYDVIEGSRWRATHPRDTRDIYDRLRGE